MSISLRKPKKATKIEKISKIMYPSSIPFSFWYTLRKDNKILRMDSESDSYSASSFLNVYQKAQGIEVGHLKMFFSKVQVLSFPTHFLSCVLDHYITGYSILIRDSSIRIHTQFSLPIPHLGDPVSTKEDFS